MSRTRQLVAAAVLERLFDHVFARCVARGLVAGDTQAVDSAPVKANASLDSVCQKQPAGARSPLLAPGEPAPTVTAPVRHLRREAARQAKRRTEPGPVGAQHEKARLLSNKTHRAPPTPTHAFSSNPARRGPYTTSAAWLSTRPKASSATYRPITLTAATACPCPACSPACSGACAPMNCTCVTSWPMPARLTARITRCSTLSRSRPGCLFSGSTSPK